jgi:hypothetical protein
MALSIQQQVAQLLQIFSNAQIQIGNMNPQEQIRVFQDYATGSLSDHTAVFTELQRKVHIAYLHQSRDSASMSLEERAAAAKQLSESADILNNLETNNQIAMKIVGELAEKVQVLSAQTLSNVSTSQLNFLQRYVTNLSKTPGINRGNLLAIEAMQLSLSNIRASTTQQAPQATASHVQSNTEIRAEQDETLAVTSFVDQWKELDSFFKNPSPASVNPLADFEKVLSLYKSAKEYHGRTAFLLPENKNNLESQVLRQAEGLMVNIINKQKDIENTQAEQIQPRPSSSSTFQELQVAFEKYCEGLTGNYTDLGALLSPLNAAFNKLSSDEKNKLLEKVYKLLREADKFPKDKATPQNLARQPISVWQGSNEYKLEAIKQLAAASVSAAPSGPVVIVEKKADEMARHLSEAQGASATQVTLSNSCLPQAAAVRTPTGSTQATFREDRIFGDGDTPALIGINDLSALLPLLKPDASYRELEAALEKLVILESKVTKVAFKISSNTPSLVSLRPCYHLYFIHKNEQPELLVEDLHYGTNAMAGIHPATNEQRSRAIQRTIVELALEGLEDAINFGAGDTISAMMKTLEEMQMNAADLLQDQNIAHVLFGSMYTLHCAARETNPLLINPSDSQFNNDFGRNAFSSAADRINLETKIAAIGEIRQALKVAWKVQ